MNWKIFTYSFLLVAVTCLFWPTASIAQETAPHNEGWFYADEHPEIVDALASSEFSQGVLDALADAGTNWTELWAGIDALSRAQREDACWLVVNMPHLDRLEMTQSILLEHVRFAYMTKTNLPYTVPDDLFREYILAYRIGDEPVRPWRSQIWFGFQDLIRDSPANTARAVNQWVYDNLTKRERGFFGPRPDPMAVITSGSGTESDIAAAAIAMCKTFGVPARQATVSVLGEEKGSRTWLEIYIGDGRWVPMYPDNPPMFGNPRLIEHERPHNVTVVSASTAFKSTQVTSRYSDTGTVHLVFTKSGEPVDNFEHFTISAWNDGAWMPLDDLGFDLEEEKIAAEAEEGFTAILGDGFYVVQVGVRNSRGDAYVQTVPVQVNPNDEIDLTFALDIPAGESQSVDLIQRALDPLPEVQLGYASPLEPGYMFPNDLAADTYMCIVIFDPGQEPTIRMLPMISEWAASAPVQLVGVGVGDPQQASDVWTQGTSQGELATRFFADPDGTIAKAFGQNPDEQGAYTNLPFVLLISADRKIHFLWDGFNLSVAEGLARAVELDTAQELE